MTIEKRYFIVSVNKTKVGFYYFIGFVNYRPMFEPNHCVSKGPRFFKTEKSAQNALKRVNGYYRNMPQIISTIVNTFEFDRDNFYDQFIKELHN